MAGTVRLGPSWDEIRYYAVNAIWAPGTFTRLGLGKKASIELADVPLRTENNLSKINMDSQLDK